MLYAGVSNKDRQTSCNTRDRFNKVATIEASNIVVDSIRKLTRELLRKESGRKTSTGDWKDISPLQEYHGMA